MSGPGYHCDGCGDYIVHDGKESRSQAQEDLRAEVARLCKQNDHYERALREIESSPYCDYFHGITRTLTEAERSYRTGVTDGHRAAASVARDALGLVTTSARSGEDT